MHVQSIPEHARQYLAQLVREHVLSDAEIIARVAELVTGCEKHGAEHMQADADGVICGQCDAETAAYELGAEHHYHGGAWDMWTDDSARLMDYLGQTGPTTDANAADRMAMCDAYVSGLGGAR